MPVTSLLLPGGYTGPGVSVYPVSVNPGGAVLYVNSVGGSNGRGRVSGLGGGLGVQGPYGDPNKALASVFGTDGAASFCTASRGDLIICLPGHTEALTGANTLPAGVTVLGLGYGSARPTFTMTTAITANFAIDIGGRLQNCIVTGIGFDAITAMISLNAGSQVIDCRVVMADATNQALTGIAVFGSDCLIARTEINGLAAAGGASGIRSGIAVARLTVDSCVVEGDFSLAPISSASTFHITDMVVRDCVFRNTNSGTAAINFTTSSTGVIRNCSFMVVAVSALAGVIANSSNVALRWFENYAMEDTATAVSGILCPVAGTIS